MKKQPINETPEITAERGPIDRYLTVFYRDEYGVPTWEVVSYFTEDPKSKNATIEWSRRVHDGCGHTGFEVIADCSEAAGARAVGDDKLDRLQKTIPLSERLNWPSEEDRRYDINCPECGFGYCPRLPLDAKQHSDTGCGYRDPSETIRKKRRKDSGKKMVKRVFIQDFSGPNFFTEEGWDEFLALPREEQQSVWTGRRRH
jgi:hypothetical protein